MKIIWIDTETSSLRTPVANVLDLAVMVEIDRELVGDLNCLVQPPLHEEDKLYGHLDPQVFLDSHNEKCENDPHCFLESFQFAPGDPPLFFYSPGTLSLGMPAGQLKDPSRWLTDQDRLEPKQALMKLVELLDRHRTISGRWTVAGHNPQYDFNVLTAWGQRVLGPAEYRVLGDRLNSYWFLDTVALARWHGYRGSLRTEGNKYRLDCVAKALGIPLADAHTAKADLTATYQVAKTLLGG